MKHIEEKDGKVFIDGIEYVPKETKGELPKCYSDIVKKHKYLGNDGWVITTFGNLSIKSIGSDTEGVFFNIDFAKAMLKLKNLLEIRDEYNGDWKLDLNDVYHKKYNLVYIQFDGVSIYPTFNYIASIFIFKSEKLAEQFLKNYKEDIEFVFRYLYMWN